MMLLLKVCRDRLAISVFLFVFAVLSIMQIQLDRPMLIFERFVVGAGWIEIFFVSLYGAIIAFKMRDPKNVPLWRQSTWVIFSIVFFGQLFLGLLGFEKFLMTGELHLPIPAMIVSGPIYRSELSVMTILFLSTIILSGPAWCSHLCYFGALDAISSKQKKNNKPIKNKMQLKVTFLVLVVFATILLKWLALPSLNATISGIIFGLMGIFVIVFISRRKGKMYHCVLYCPIGIIVNYTKFINPFRLYIDKNCTSCMKCTVVCKYDALNLSDIKNKKPGITCTLCGDCLSSCEVNSFKYKFFNLSPQFSRNLYLFITISIHVIFLALARI